VATRSSAQARSEEAEQGLKTMALPASVRIVEVGPRDGLQNEPASVSAETKARLIERLADAGCPNVEAAAFVSPKWVPQMADSAEVMALVRRRPGTVYSALVPNRQGLEKAIAAHIDEVVVFGAASEAFSMKNINCSIAESMERFAPVAKGAKDAGLRLRGSASCALGCPYQGEVPVTAVVDLVKRLADLGCDEIDIADTIGVGTPGRTQEVMHAAAAVFPIERLSGHFHDTYGQALANVYASMECGIAIFHSSVAGLGGCPYAKGATGNVATEDLLYMLDGLGIETGVDLEKIYEAGRFIGEALKREPASRVARAMAAKRRS
jgi:hydroxymethylglutaryl-CoA lyase